MRQGNCTRQLTGYPVNRRFQPQRGRAFRRDLLIERPFDNSKPRRGRWLDAYHHGVISDDPEATLTTSMNRVSGGAFINKGVVIVVRRIVSCTVSACRYNALQPRGDDKSVRLIAYRKDSNALCSFRPCVGCSVLSVPASTLSVSPEQRCVN